jgi:hypothetical protein
LNKSLILIHYSFVSPTGKNLAGSRRKISPCLINDKLPEAGTPVNILYADDDCHMLL